MNDNVLKGKVAVVTGASRGIGRGIATALAQRGAHVVLGARNSEKLHQAADQLRSQSLAAETAILDVTREEDWKALAEHLRGKFGKLDILVNNAGIGNLGRPMIENSVKE